MKGIVFFLLFVLNAVSFAQDVTSSRISEENVDADVQKWLAKFETTVARPASLFAEERWSWVAQDETYSASCLDHKADVLVRIIRRHREESKKFDQSKIKNQSLVYQLKQLQTYVYFDEFDKRFDIQGTLRALVKHQYSDGTICAWRNNEKNCSERWTSKDIEKALSQSPSYNKNQLERHVMNEVLQRYRPACDLYQYYVEAWNNLARSLNYTDAGALWRVWYGTPDVLGEPEQLWRLLLPYYEILHSWVRTHLYKKYQMPPAEMSSAIPIHLIQPRGYGGWMQHFNASQPYPNIESVDVTNAMQRANYTAKKIFQIAQSFFTSLGFENLTESFWKESILQKPTDRNFTCFPGLSMDTLNGKQRMLICTEIKMDSLRDVYHEMGHVHYYMQYAHLPLVFRNAAHNGFHEASGEVVAMSFNTPKHLRAIGLLQDDVTQNATLAHMQSINFLYRQALFAFERMALNFVTDIWRWSVFNDSLKVEDWNKGWWDLHYQTRGVQRFDRNDTIDFDPFYYVLNNFPAMPYLYATILQFQFNKAMCTASGHTGPLHECDFYNSKEAGAKLKKLFSYGRSVPWQVALKEMTGDGKVSVEALAEYFQPLFEYMKEEIRKSNGCFGWNYPWPDSVMQTLPTPRCGSDAPV